jgi:NodT family efflux transporter outer membrane factor (OMF) lipoprotein
MYKALFWLWVSLGAVACAIPQRPAPDIEVDIPDNWESRGYGVEGTLAGWWLEFDNAGLQQAIEIALQENYDLKAAVYRLDAAAAQARIVGADLYPHVNAQFTGSRQKRNFIGFPIPGSGGEVPSNTSNLYGVSFNINWEVDLWGRIRAARSASWADFQAVEADLAGFQLSLVGQTIKAWFAAVEADMQTKLSEATVSNYQASNNQVRRRYRLGLTPPLEVRLSESNVANAEAVLIFRRDQLQRSKKQLDVLLGRYPAGRLTLDEDLPGLQSDIPAGLPADIVRRRPDLVAAEKRLAAAYARVLESKRALYPRISLTASGGTSSDELKNLVNGDYSVWNLVGNLLQPLFQGGRLRAGVALSEAREQENLALYANQVLYAYAEVEAALEAEQLLKERELALQEAAEQAVAARELADQRYVSGLTDLIPVLESQRRAFIAQSELLSVKRQRLDNRVDLYLALGGGFGEESAPVDLMDQGGR